jgi:hypothetical protein
MSRPIHPIARLGRRKWHVVRVYGSSSALVGLACGIVLRDGDLGERVEKANGEPTCKHCVRWRKKREVR